MNTQFFDLHTIKIICGLAGTFLLGGSTLPYLWAFARGRIKPHAFSWLLWALINAIVFAAQTTSDAGAGAWTAGMTAFANTVIGIAAVFYGTRDITRGDWVIFLSVLAALPLWAMTKDPLWSVVLVSILDVLAFWPTVRKSWRAPNEEAVMPFALGCLGFACALVAVKTYALVNVIYLAVVIMANTVFITMIFLRRRQLAAGV